VQLAFLPLGGFERERGLAHHDLVTTVDRHAAGAVLGAFFLDAIMAGMVPHRCDTAVVLRTTARRDAGPNQPSVRQGAHQ